MEVTQFKERIIPHLQSQPAHTEFADELQNKLLSFPDDVPRSSIIHSQDVSTRKVFIQIIEKYIGNDAEWPIEIRGHSAMDEIMDLKQRCKGQRARFVTMQNLFPPSIMTAQSSGSSVQESLELPGFDALDGESNSRNKTAANTVNPHHVESPGVSPEVVNSMMSLRLTNLASLQRVSSPFALAMSPSASKSNPVFEDNLTLLRSMAEALDLALDDVIQRMRRSFDKFKMTLVWWGIHHFLFSDYSE